ncbi:hypothetical protein PIB30_039594 [Stylosanthes scabra]|uniref:Secreted protein n=1 Tax=Stylosanthes scabra TaxID=79078 RepID=A0ABU6YBR3_9FABA|nr:hypothetical protein [Stylosanthes scabra]
MLPRARLVFLLEQCALATSTGRMQMGGTSRPPSRLVMIPFVARYVYFPPRILHARRNSHVMAPPEVLMPYFRDAAFG